MTRTRGACSPALVQDFPFLGLSPPRFGSRESTVSHTNPRQLADRLSQSQILRDYEEAFSRATGLPLAFQPAGQIQPAIRSSEFANPFCSKLIATDAGCQLCADIQKRLTGQGTADTRSETCRAGLTDSAVPVRLGQETLGYLQTGQVAVGKIARGSFRKLVRWMEDGGAHADWHALEKSYFESPQLSPERYAAMLHLLEVFAQHLSIAAEQLATQESNSEPPMVTRARQFIAEHQTEDIALGDVARAVHASTFHFCKMFKKATGMTFTEYLSLVRVGKAKKFLANPQMRISEIAFEVGFNSLTHFNRVFRKFAGKSPTDYRAALSKKGARAT